MLDEAENQINNHLKLLKQRWMRGIDRFKEALVNFKHNDQRTKTIRTAIHGDITLTGSEIFFVDSFFLQRLKGISHMGFTNFVYPEARHSRFEHSLGVFWIIKKLMDSQDWKGLDNGDRKNLIYASLLHDIGHGPFSHSSEYILECLGLDDVLRMRLVKGEKSKPHERRAKQMISDEDFQLIFLKRNTYHINEALQVLGANPEKVCEMITGITHQNPLTALINGPVDSDKLDYYQRDAYFTGVPAGNIDTQFMMRVLVQGRNGEPVFKEKAVSTLIHMLFSREYVYSVVPFHPVVRIAQAMFVIAFIEALFCLSINMQIKILLYLDMMSDSDLWTVLDIIASHSGNRTLQNLLDRLRSRELYKRWKTLSLEDCKKFGFGIRVVDITEDMSDDEAFINTSLLPLSYLKSDDFDSGLGEDIKENEMIIFEIIPKPKSPRERKEKFRNDLNAIKIKCENTRIRSLYNKLGGSQKSLTNGLARFQHILSKALLLHPSDRGDISLKTMNIIVHTLKDRRRPRLSREAREAILDKLSSLRKEISHQK